MCSGLVDSLVGEGTGAGHDTNFTFGVDVARHNTDLALTRLDDTWAVRSNQTGLVLGLHDGLDLDHVKSGNAFSDADNEVHLGLNGFQNGVSSEGGRNVDDGSFGISSGLGIADGAKDGESEVLGASLAGVDSTNDLGAVGQRLLSVESSLYKEARVKISF